jgi:hypothetical protein
MSFSTPARLSNQAPIYFKDFTALARRRNWTAQSLAQRFRGHIENAADFFNRLLSDKFPDSIIPYRSVLEFYAANQLKEPPRADSRRVCACGCGRPVFDRKKWATPGCKKKHARNPVRDYQKCPREVVDFVDARPGQNRRMATLPLTRRETGTNGL